MNTGNDTGGAGPSQRAVECGVALAGVVLGLVAIGGSLKVGIGWGAEGPRSGFFPFYVGIAIILACLVNLVEAWRARPGALFASWSRLRLVVAVVIPTTIYVAAIPFLGLYVCSAVLIAGFMLRLDKYNPAFAVAIALGVVAVTFVTFEWWFLVPLPKGPLEDLLGL